MCQIQVSAGLPASSRTVPAREPSSSLTSTEEWPAAPYTPRSQTYRQPLFSAGPLQTDEAIAAAAFRRGPTGNTAVVIVTEMTALNAETDAVIFNVYTGLMAAGACQNPVIVHCLCQHGGIQGDFCTISIFTAQIPALITVPVEGVVKGTGLQPVPRTKALPPWWHR